MTRGDVDVDGIPVGFKSIPIGRAGSQDTVERSYISTSATTTRPMLFSSLKLTGMTPSLFFIYRSIYEQIVDNDDYIDTIACHKLGNIILTIWRCKDGGNSSFAIGRPVPEDKTVHERSKKGTSHCVG